MKKLLLSSLLFGSLVLSACSSGVNDVKGNSKIIAKARLDLRDSNKLSIGSVNYKHRGDEADRVKQVGLQGQTDLMINELFKNN